MKTKITFLMLLLVVVSSCVKDFEGNGEQTQITDENTMYEGDVYRKYLNLELDELEALIKELGAVSPDDPGYDEAKADKEAAEEKQKDFLNTRNGILSLEQAGLDIQPPCPDIIVGECRPRLLANLLFSIDFIAAQVSFIDDKGEVINAFNELQPLAGFENDLLLMKIALPEVSGAVIMKVDKVDTQEVVTSYQQLISN